MRNTSLRKFLVPLFPAQTNADGHRRFAPWRLFIIILASIFIAEIVAMMVVYFISPLSYGFITLIDAAIMVTLIFPVLYRFSFYPLIQQIEKLQQAEQKLELERARLRSILDTMPDGIYIVNQQFDVEYANPVIEQQFGPLDGRKCYAYFHDQEEACPWCKNASVFEGETVHWEWDSSRTGKTYDVFDTPLANSDGSVSKLKIIHDITERKLAEEKLRRAYDDLEVRVQDRTEELRIANSELEDEIHVRRQVEDALRAARNGLEIRVRERTEDLAAANRELSNEINERKEIERQLRIQTAAMESAANGILITDPRGRILWTNPAVTQISGYTERDLLGQSTHIFSSGQHDGEFYNRMWETILSGRVWRGETTNRRKDGVVYVEEQTITPVQSETGELSHFIAIKQDITERKLIYAQLEGSNWELQTLTASERQQRFLAEGLVESSVVLNMSLDLHAVLDHIFEQTRRTIPYLMADVVLIEAEVASVVRQWGEGGPESRTISENDSLSLQEFPIWEEICATKSVYMIPDTSLDAQWNGYFGMSWIRSYLGAPLIYNDQVIGIINLSSDRENAFHQDTAKNLMAFAAPAAVAIRNARLYEDEKQHRKAAEILSAASVALAQTLDIQTVMETILDYLQIVMPAGIAFVILSEGEERYRIRAVRANNRSSVQLDLRDRTIDILNEPIISSYFSQEKSTFIPDSRHIPEWSPPMELASFHCWLGIPLESMGKSLGMVVIADVRPNSYTQPQIRLAEAVIKQAVVALQNAWLFEQVRSGRERLQLLSRHLVDVQENERKYIARELHDETSQSLTSLKMGLQVIEQKAAEHPQLMEQVVNLKELADETLASLHHLAVNLRPASLDHLGLVNALTGLIDSIRQRSGMTAHFKTMGTVPDAALNDEIESSMYRIVQESLTNVLRHAHANYVDVILEWQTEKVIIIIEDDGVGIDMQKARETGHLGMIGMQERAEMLGGKLLVESTPQAGTTLVVEIPYVNSNINSR
jgi:PAS domain S-box-containing protein